MKRVCKQILDGLATALVFPLVLLYLVARAISGVHAFPGFSQIFSLLPGFSGVFLRRAFYRSVLARSENDVCLSFGTVFSHPGACVGHRVYIGVGCMIGEVTLEDDVLIASHVSVINGGKPHRFDRLDVPIREQAGEYPRVTVGRDSWIGERAVVMADVGKHCVIGAGSVVTRPIPDYAVAVGCPARVIRYRNQAEVPVEAS